MILQTGVVFNGRLSMTQNEREGQLLGAVVRQGLRSSECQDWRGSARETRQEEEA